MSFKHLRKPISILIILTFFFTNINVSYATPSSKSLFKNKKVDYDKISSESQDSLQKRKSVLKGEDAKEAISQQKEAKKVLSSHLEDISQIHIPQEIGRIVEVYNNATSTDKKPNLIVHIQDLHTNPEAELNLAKILEILLKDYNMALVCSEGADGKVDTSSISSFPDSQAKERVSRIFIDSGELTGEEYLSITKYPELPIWGIETKDIYFKNIIGFNKIMQFNPQSQTFISQVKKAITELKPKVYSKDLLDLDQKESEFSSQKLDTAKYIKYLLDSANMVSFRDRSKNIDNILFERGAEGTESRTAKYKNIFLLKETMAMEKAIDQQKIMKDSQNLLLTLQSTLQSKSLNNDLDGLMARANLFKDQKISPFSFYSYLKDLANKHLKEDFALKYPSLNSFVDYLAKVNSLDSTKLFTELEDLNFAIKEALSKTDEQKTLVKLDHNINFLESFFNLKVSNEGLDYYLNNKDSHKVAFFKDFLSKTLKRYNINTFIDYNPDLIDSHLQELEDFYKVVKDRDIAMVTNSLSEIEKRNAKVSSLIAGGFHTKGITKLLREKGYSYIVVSPYSKTDIDEENYHFLLSGKRKPITDLIKKYLNLPEIVNRLTPSTLRVPLAYSETAEAFAQQIAAKVGGERTAAELAENMAVLLSVTDHADIWTGFGKEGIVGRSRPRSKVVVVPWGKQYLRFTANEITIVSVEQYTGTIVVNIPPAGTQVAAVAKDKPIDKETVAIAQAISALEKRVGQNFSPGQKQEIIEAAKIILQMSPVDEHFSTIAGIINVIQETNVANEDRAKLQAQGLAVPPTFVFTGKDLNPDYEARHIKFVAITIDKDFVAVNVVSSIVGDTEDIISKGGIRVWEAGVGNLDKMSSFIEKLKVNPYTEPLLPETAKLGSSMWFKNVTNGWDGGKINLVMAKGANKLDVLMRLARSSIVEKMLLTRYFAGPDSGTGEPAISRAIVEEADRVQDILGRPKAGNRGRMLATTGRAKEDGGFPHAELAVTSRTVTETMLVALTNHDLLTEMGSIGEDGPITLSIEGFGDVASGIVQVLFEFLQNSPPEYAKVIQRIRIVSVSNITGAIYNKDGLDIKELIRLREQWLATGGKKDPDLTKEYKGVADVHEGKDNGQWPLFCGATVIIPASVMQLVINSDNYENVPDTTRLIVEGGNDSISQHAIEKLEEKGKRIIWGRVANVGGVQTSVTAELELAMMYGEAKVKENMGQYIPWLLDGLRKLAKENAECLILEHIRTGRPMWQIHSEMVDKIRAIEAKLLKDNPRGKETGEMGELVSNYISMGLPQTMARRKAANELANKEIMKGIGEEPPASARITVLAHEIFANPEILTNLTKDTLAAMALQYGLTRGHPILLKYLSGMLGKEGITAHPDTDVVVLDGIADAEQILARLLITKDNIVVYQSGSLSEQDKNIYKYYGARLIEIDLSSTDGINELESRLGRGDIDSTMLKFVQVLSNTKEGTEALSERARKMLLALVQKYGLLLVEDGRYRSPVLPGKADSLKAFDEKGSESRVIQLRNLSTLFGKEAELGCAYVVMPSQLAVKVEAAKASITLHPNSLMQAIAYKELLKQFGAQGFQFSTLTDEERNPELSAWLIDKLSDYGRNVKLSEIRRILKLMAIPGLVSFAGGMPAIELFPYEATEKLIASFNEDEWRVALANSPAQGLEILRSLLADRLNKENNLGRKESLSGENIIITEGSQDGLDLLGWLVKNISNERVDRNNIVITQKPTYLGFISAAEPYGCKANPYDLNSLEGLQKLCDNLKSKRNRNEALPSLIYVMPTFGNPDGDVMSLAARERLLEIANEFEIMIAEDNPYGALKYEKEAGQPTLLELSKAKKYEKVKVIYLGTVSKTFTPGMRIGWTVAPVDIISKFTEYKKATASGANAFNQLLVTKFIATGLIDSHVQTKLIAEYSKRRAAMISALEKYMPTGVSWTKGQGGYFIWVTLPESVNAEELLVELTTKGRNNIKLGFVPGWPFLGEPNQLRLSFPTNSPEVIDAGIKALAVAIKDKLAGTLAAARSGDKGIMSKAEHEIMRDFLERVKARNDENRRQDLEKKYKVSETKQRPVGVKIYAVPGMYNVTGFKGHYAIRDGIVYIDKDILEGKDGEIYLQHEVVELMGIWGLAAMKFEGLERKEQLNKIVKWLDEEGDPAEVMWVLKNIHDTAPKLPKGSQEIIADMPEARQLQLAIAIVRTMLENIKETGIILTPPYTPYSEEAFKTSFRKAYDTLNLRDEQYYEALFTKARVLYTAAYEAADKRFLAERGKMYNYQDALIPIMPGVFEEIIAREAVRGAADSNITKQGIDKLVKILVELNQRGSFLITSSSLRIGDSKFGGNQATELPKKIQEEISQYYSLIFAVLGSKVEQGSLNEKQLKALLMQRAGLGGSRSAAKAAAGDKTQQAVQIIEELIRILKEKDVFKYFESGLNLVLKDTGESKIQEAIEFLESMSKYVGYEGSIAKPRMLEAVRQLRELYSEAGVITPDEHAIFNAVVWMNGLYLEQYEDVVLEETLGVKDLIHMQIAPKELNVLSKTGGIGGHFGARYKTGIIAESGREGFFVYLAEEMFSGLGEDAKVKSAQHEASEFIRTAQKALAKFGNSAAIKQLGDQGLAIKNNDRDSEFRDLVNWFKKTWETNKDDITTVLVAYVGWLDGKDSDRKEVDAALNDTHKIAYPLPQAVVERLNKYAKKGSGAKGGVRTAAASQGVGIIIENMGWTNRANNISSKDKALIEQRLKEVLQSRLSQLAKEGQLKSDSVITDSLPVDSVNYGGNKHPVYCNFILNATQSISITLTFNVDVRDPDIVIANPQVSVSIGGSRGAARGMAQATALSEVTVAIDVLVPKLQGLAQKGPVTITPAGGITVSGMEPMELLGYTSGTKPVLDALWTAIHSISALQVLDIEQGASIDEIRAKLFEAAGLGMAVEVESLPDLDIFNLTSDDAIYTRALYAKFKNPTAKPLVIGANFKPSALLSKQDRRNLLGAIEYGSIAGNQDYITAARRVNLVCNPVDGGIGSSVARLEYLAQIWGRISRTSQPKMGAKGTDLYFEIILDGYDKDGGSVKKKVMISVMELKYLRVIDTAKGYNQVMIQELVNSESQESVRDFLKKTYLLDYLDDRIPEGKKRSYEDIIQMGNIKRMPDIVQGELPSIDMETGQLTSERMAPGGHGYLGTIVLQEAQTVELPSDGSVLIRAIYSGDGSNNAPDAAMIGWMAQERIPIVMVSTTKIALDKKGGSIGVEYLEGGKVRTQMCELAQAKSNGQEDLFYRIGLPGDKGDEGEAGAQYFNTNTAMVNYSILAPFLRDLRILIGEEEFNKIITPDLIKNEKEQGGKKFIQLEGALGSALLNLNGFIQASDDPKVKALLEKHKIGKLLFIINVNSIDRTDFFTPIKYAIDYWLQAYSDHFVVDTQEWRLRNVREDGHLPEVSEGLLQNKYYMNVWNCIAAFGNASTKNLDKLDISGNVNLKDAVLSGEVVIRNEHADVVDLNAENYREVFAKAGMLKDGVLNLKDVEIVINKSKEISILKKPQLAESRVVTSNYCVLEKGVVSLREQQIDLSKCGDDEAIIKVALAGICRADVKEVTDSRDVMEDRGPLFGHELVGEVVVAGKDTGFKKGDRVTFNPNITPDRTTGFANYFSVKGARVKEALNIVPGEIPLEKAVLSEPLACVVRSMDKLLSHMGLTDLKGKRVAIIGAGNAGTLHMLLAKHLGAEEIVMLDVDPNRLDYLRKHGLFDGQTVVFNKEDTHEDFGDDKDKFDVVIIVPTAITSKTLKVASQFVVKEGGYIHLYGGTRKDSNFAGVNIDPIRREERKETVTVDRKSISFTGAYGADSANFQKAFTLLQEPGFANAGELVSTEITLTELPAFIMEMAKGDEDPPGKVVVVPASVMVKKEDKAVLDRTVLKNYIGNLTDALKNIGFTDLDALALEIIKQYPRGIAPETLSFIVSNDGLWIVGPEQEDNPQVFIRISPDKKAGVSEDISKVVGVSKAELVSEEVSIGNVTKISIAATEPYARREMIRQVVANLITKKETIAEGLSHSKPAYQITPLMERFIFGAQLEKKYLEGFKKAAEEAKKKYPKLVELYEHMTDPSKKHIPFKLEIPADLFSELNIDKIVAMWIKDAPLATAGLRKGSNPLAFFDASADMNMLLSLFIGNELAEMTVRTAKGQGIDTINAIVGGETRYNTDFNNEMLARRFAAMGITVHRPKPGTLLSIGATSFITTLMDIKFADYDTASHSARATFASKVMGSLKPYISPFLRKAFGILGIDVKKYEMARSEGAQLLIEDMKALAENFKAKVEHCKQTNEPLIIEFAAGDDEHIRFDIENEEHPENISVIARYVKYLKEGYVTAINIKAVQDALSNGMKVGFDMASGSATRFFRGVFEGVFGKERADDVVWTATVPDSYFKDTGMTDFNPKQLIENNLIKNYAGNMQKELETFFGTLPLAYTLVATISKEDFAKRLGENQDQLNQTPGLGDRFKKQNEVNIRFRIFAKEEEGFLKRFGLPYIRLNNGNLLGCYNADLYDLSQDVSLLQVVANSKLPAFMLDKPIGYIHKTTDPDADRYVALQVERNDGETKTRLEKLGVGYLVLSEEKLLAVYVPNQTFFQLQYAYIKQLQAEGKFKQNIDDPDAITYFEIKTTVSSAAWDALCKFFGIPVVQVPVGFKEISAIMRKVEEQIKLNDIRKALGLKPRMVIVHDILGNPIKLGYNPRLLFAGEESGGMIVGSEKLLTTEDGLRQYLSWREKNAVEASTLMFMMISNMFNKAREIAAARGVKDKELYNDQQFLDNMSLSKQIEKSYQEIGFERYELRADIELADMLKMATVSREERTEMTREAEKRRDTNFAFFLSLAFALEDGHITLGEVKAILKEVLLSDTKMMATVEAVTDKNAKDVLLKQLDDMQGYTFVGDGVYMIFSNGWYEIRPSGTDVKIKSYPSTGDAKTSAVIANALGEVYPKIFFEIAKGEKKAEDMTKTTEYMQNMRAKDETLLDRDKIIARKQAQYEKGLKVDTMPDWFANESIQQLLLELFPEELPDGTKITSVGIFLGPKSQKEPLRYDQEAHIIYVSWAFDAIIENLTSDSAKIKDTFMRALASHTNEGGEQLQSILTKLKYENARGQLDSLYGKSFEEAEALGAAKMASVGFETAKDGKKINRLGWTLENVKWVLENPAKVQQVLDDAKAIRAKYKYVIFCGMGGSGLSVQTVKTTFGEPKGLNIYSLRTTDPAVIKDILNAIASDAGSLEEALRQTLIIPISKSGTTQETVSHKEYFEKLFASFTIDITEHMWVVTDKGSPMDTGKYQQIEIQLNGKEDIGGRFTSPATHIFLLPLALVAPERVEAILNTTRTMNEIGDINKDTFVRLGAYLYHMASALGKDKVTFMVPDGLRDLPMWSEQLFEESLGKGGKGVTIFYGEDISAAALKDVKENDRVFLRVNVGNRKTNDELWRHLEENGYPVFEINIEDINSIGGVMLGLQRAVAIVGYLWDICFVDQPAVEGYKNETRKVMAGLKDGDSVEVPKDWKSVSFNSIKLYYDRLIAAGAFTEEELRAEVEKLGSTIDNAPCVYAAIINILRSKPGFEAKELTSYGRMTEGMKAVLQQVRKDIFTYGLRMPSKLGEGPDKNHSYQQNIEDGRDMWFSTYFMPLKVEQPEALPYDDNLIKAQTLGTVNSIVNKGRKVALITFDSTTKEAEKDVDLFFKEVERYLKVSTKQARQGAFEKDHVIAVSAETVKNDKPGFVRWLSNLPKNYGVSIVVMDMKIYNEVIEFDEGETGRVTVINVSDEDELRLKFIADFAISEGKADFFGGFELGEAYKSSIKAAASRV